MPTCTCNQCLSCLERQELDKAAKAFGRIMAQPGQSWRGLAGAWPEYQKEARRAAQERFAAQQMQGAGRGE